MTSMPPSEYPRRVPDGGAPPPQGDALREAAQAAGPPLGRHGTNGDDGATGRTVPARKVKRSRTGGIWIGVIIAAIVLVLLLVFIVQNTASVTIRFLGFSGNLPIAVALLMAAVCGVLLVAIPGTVRIVQLRRAVRRPTPTDSTQR